MSFHLISVILTTYIATEIILEARASYINRYLVSRDGLTGMFIAYFFLLVTVPLSYYLGFVEGIKFFGGLNIVGQILYTSIILTFGIFVFAGAYRWRYTESTITGKLLSGLFSKLGVPNGLEKFVRLLYGR